ncbi:DUF305 domain-containing protein [Gordonia sp. DT219]|uniref:DUF305 domain-containing protein n=1 Tax=Gordonia sp. DT219 TaxID=3416658 RepID=UPI003CE85905
MYLTTTRKLASAAAALATAALIASACSSTDPGPESTGAGHSGHGSSVTSAPVPSAPVTSAPGMSAHNAADVMFTQMMIPHHEQAVAMADLVPTRTQNAQLRALATQIKNAQQPEIDQMTARLKSWGVAVDGTGHGGHSMDDGQMSSGEMGGMMPQTQMEAMEKATGAQFDTLWLQGMIAHHQGAIAMADDELKNGINPESRALATRIKTSQQAEIDQMNAMLGR